MTALIELHYLPCIAWFSVALKHKALRLERQEHFIKQTYRNRCYIVTSQGLQSLNVPVLHGHGKVRTSDVRIDNSQKWVNNHWRTITTAYGKSPFFEYYCDDLRKILFVRHDFLYNLNLELLTMCLRWLRCHLAVEETLTYEPNVGEVNEDAIADYRGMISFKEPWRMQEVYQAIPYQQVFGNSFAENASLIDLIFCSGPEAGRIVNASAR